MFPKFIFIGSKTAPKTQLCGPRTQFIKPRMSIPKDSWSEMEDVHSDALLLMEEILHQLIWRISNFFHRVSSINSIIDSFQSAEFRKHADDWSRDWVVVDVQPLMFGKTHQHPYLCDNPLTSLPSPGIYAVSTRPGPCLSGESVHKSKSTRRTGGALVGLRLWIGWDLEVMDWIRCMFWVGIDYCMYCQFFLGCFIVSQM